jgi:hypothetical protein
VFYSKGIDNFLVGMFVSLKRSGVEGVVRSAVPAAAFMDDRYNVMLKVETKTRGIVEVLVPFASKDLAHLMPKAS